MLLDEKNLLKSDLYGRLYSSVVRSMVGRVSGADYEGLSNNTEEFTFYPKSSGLLS